MSFFTEQFLRRGSSITVNSSGDTQLVQENTKKVKECIKIFKSIEGYISKPDYSLVSDLSTHEGINELNEQVKQLKPKLNTEQWSDHEHKLLIDTLYRIGNEPRVLAEVIVTRNPKQIISHLQKYNLKLQKTLESPQVQHYASLNIEFVNQFKIFMHQHQEYCAVKEIINVILEPPDIKNILTFDKEECEHLFEEVYRNVESGCRDFKRLSGLPDNQMYLLEYACEVNNCNETEVAACVVAELFDILVIPR